MGASEGKETYEETSTNRTTDSNHLKVAGLHLLLEKRIVVGNIVGDILTVNHKTPGVMLARGRRTAKEWEISVDALI